SGLDELRSTAVDLEVVGNAPFVHQLEHDGSNGNVLRARQSEVEVSHYDGDGRLLRNRRTADGGPCRHRPQTGNGAQPQRGDGTGYAHLAHLRLLRSGDCT